jgi:hydrogenase small subunit
MKTKILWLQGLACNGNAHSFLNYTKLDQFLKDFEFLYHPIIDSDLGLKDIVDGSYDLDILIIEGSIADDFKRANTDIVDIISNYAKRAKKILTVGTCATFGGVFKDSPYPNSSGFLYLKKENVERFSNFKDKVISVSGCPIHPETLVNTLYMIREDLEIKVDNFNRPKEFFSYTVHNGCTRNEYFEYKVDDHIFGKKEGCMFYEHGCQAPYTHGSCNKILWNEVSSKTRVGEPCHGCTEPNFPKENLYETKKNMGIPQYLPLGVPKRAYLTLTGVTKAFKIGRLEKGLFDE